MRDEDVITYGSNPKKQFNYICPRYWCLKNNTIIDPKDLKEVITNGKKELIHPTCGKVLARGDKQVKPGYYIYEFYQPTAKNEKRYPGFQTDKHPKGFCLPCCFDKYNTEGRIKANNKCSQKPQIENEKPTDKEVEKNKKIEEYDEEEPENDEYVKGPDKFPLDPGRWGYLPVGIQTILHEVNADCQISKTNTNLKQDHPCLLRHGIEINKNQSFIACISDLIFFAKKNISGKTEKILNIKEMRERIIKSLNIDNFIKYQNGNLVNDFYNKNKATDINKYKNTKLFKKLNIDNSEDEFYYKKVVSAFENFIDFLSDDDALIDHTYLWDIVSMPNNNIFPRGVNLVILKIPNDDITNNIQLLCPTNHYSSEFYEARKPTIILVKEDNYYEPIYSYTTTNKKIIISKEFKEYDPQLSKTMRAVFKEIIKPLFNTICRPLDSMPNIYKAKKPLLLYDLIQKLDKYNYKIIKLVVNFNNKVIGILAEEPGSLNKKGFIPCYPSGIEDTLKKDVDYVFMTDLSLWNTYDETMSFLTKLEKKSKGKKINSDIHCKPAFKIIEDEMIVGILTETNQFIQLSQPVAEQDINTEYNIPSIKNDNYIVNVKSQQLKSADVVTTTTNEVDKERVDYIKKIKMETNFYNVFRNTIRILLNDYENISLREKIQNEISKEYLIYSEKLKTINRLLRELVKNKVQFIGDDNYYKLIDEISTCIVKNKETCNNSPNLCVVTENDSCNLIIPQKNLITDKNNEPIYFGRVADEIIRYNRIKTFMFQPQTYISFGNIGYNLRDDEIIIIQSMLNQEYFDNLIPMVTNKYVTHNSYDEVQPIISQTYDNVIPALNYTIGKQNEPTCNKTTTPIVSAIWKKCFPKSYTEIEYSKSNYCTIIFIIDLIERKTGEKYTVNQIKNELYNEYTKYLSKYNDKILDILIIEGKKTLGDQVKTDTMSFASLIYTDNYFFTTLDLWLLVNKYKIPTIFISQKFVLQTNYERHCFVGYKDDTNKYAFIVLPGLRAEIIPKLKIIQTEETEVFISLDKLNGECVEKINESIRNKISIEDYLINFTKKTKSNYSKKKPLQLIIEDDDEEISQPIQEKNAIVQEDKLVAKKIKKVKKVKQPQAKLIIEEDEDFTPPIAEKELHETIVEQSTEQLVQIPQKNKRKRTKKQKIILKGNNKTKKNEENEEK